jgi:hypothetical protein
MFSLVSRKFLAMRNIALYSVGLTTKYRNSNFGFIFSMENMKKKKTEQQDTLANFKIIFITALTTQM